jgi:hypothetical protein
LAFQEAQVEVMTALTLVVDAHHFEQSVDFFAPKTPLHWGSALEDWNLTSVGVIVLFALEVNFYIEISI